MARNEVRWERMFPDELEAAFEACPMVYLPYGLCEPHGWHNAVGMDAIRAHECSIQAAQEHGGIVAPPFYWHCHEIGGYGTWAHGRVGDERPWLSAMPPWMFLKNMCYHIRAVDALGFQGAILFSGHSGPHRLDVPVVIEIMQAHVGVRMYSLMSVGTDIQRYEDGKGLGGHAGRGETTVLWAVAPDCVDMSRMDDSRAPNFAMGDLNETSDRRVGEQMVADIVALFGEKAKELRAAYEQEVSDHTALTYDDVEGIWEDEIRPRLSEFASMQNPDTFPPEDSRWYPNCRVPEGRIL
ncbi:MAG: creatininase family protein [bacterium]|nr:creatininase family protein [bacterium]